MTAQTRPANPTTQALRVIVPCRNEESALPRLLTDLQAQKEIALAVTVVDGESDDGSPLAAAQHGARVLHSAPGRGQQLNTGWQNCGEDTLLFLHADSRLEDSRLIANAFAAWRARHNERLAGHFRLHFYDAPQPKSLFYRHLEEKSALNHAQCFNGDQGLLIRRSFLEELGGFDPRLPFLEDQSLGAKIRQHGEWMTLPGHLGTSARRFEAEGRGARYFIMMVIMCAREAGCDEFLREVPELYREQAETQMLDVRPLVQKILHYADQQPEFWDIMARYTLNNAWQPLAVLDTALNRPGQTREPYFRYLHHTLTGSPMLRRGMAPVLRWIFRETLPRYLKTL